MADTATGTKRKADDANGTTKEQKTIEQTHPNKEERPVENNQEGKEGIGEEKEEKVKDDVETEGEEMNGADESNKVAKTEEQPKAADDHKRDDEVPSTILEKGIIYFFFRPRVGMDEPQSVQDIARTYMVLRPLETGAQLGEGPVKDVGNTRLLALPKKVLPISPRDRFMTFVEKAQVSVEDLKENFLKGSDYSTKTTGTRHTPAVTPAGEGVYSITTTGRETHLAYILTIPSELNEVQRDLGLRERGSFVTSAKNPAVGGPSYANLPDSAKFDDDIMNAFRSRGWMPLEPRMLEYANAQFLLIGEGTGELGKAVEQSDKDAKHDKEKPEEEMEKLEHENELRAMNLKGDEKIFTDLALNANEYSKLQTTW